MKTLYISDLDGTLLNSSAALTPFAIETLNRLIEEGMHFTVATARTSATVTHMLADVAMKVPVVLMNGVAIYDMAQGCYVETNNIPEQSRAFIFEVLRSEGLEGFLYVIEDNVLSTFYEKIDSPHAKLFVEERVSRFGKSFVKVDSFYSCADKNVVYYSVVDTKERLQSAYERLKRDSRICVEFYRDIYYPEHWYLEICSRLASKFHAVQRLRRGYGFDKVVSFGDNYNDLSLFEASDECYAVENAKPEVKARATGVIGDNGNDAVPRWLLKNYNKSKD